MRENKSFVSEESALGRVGAAVEGREQKLRKGLLQRIEDNLRYLDDRALRKLLIILTGLGLSYSELNETAWAQTSATEAASGLKQTPEQEKEQNRITPAEAENLIEAVPDKNDSTYYDLQKNLIRNYNKFPDDLELRAKAWPKMHPELAEFAPALAKVSDYSEAYRFFVRDLQSFVWGIGEIPGNLQDGEGGLDKEKLKQALEQAVAAIDFVDTPAESQTLFELVRGKVVNLFSDPGKIRQRGWDKFSQQVSNEHQVKIFGEIIFNARDNGQEISSPAELEPWLVPTSWIDSEEKARLVVAVQGAHSLERLSAWKNFIEKVCQPIPLIKTGESGTDINMGVNSELFLEMQNYLTRMTADGDINEQLSRAEAKYNDLITRNK